MISLFEDRILIGNEKLEYWIDAYELDNYHIRIWGWAIIVDKPSWQFDLKLDFHGMKYKFSCKPSLIKRNDVTLINGKNAVNHDASGFFAEIPRQAIGEDKYNVSFSFKEKKTNETALSFPFLCIKVS